VVLHGINSAAMQKIDYNLILQYLLILCLGLALLLTQTNRLHMHLEHNEHADVSGHVVSVHTASILHDFDLTNRHVDHHPAAIDVSPDNLIKKTIVLTTPVLILLLIGFFLIEPRLVCLYRSRFYEKLFATCYYLFHPPLRAPPIK